MRGSDQLPLPAAGLWPLAALIDDIAIIEHSIGATPDPTSGHCTDDAGRALALACAMPGDPAAPVIAERCLAFLASMHLGGGQFSLRDVTRNGDPTISHDASARAIHGLGVAAARAPWPDVRHGARLLFAEAVRFTTPHLRARAHAIIGAGALATTDDSPAGTIELIERLVVGLAAGASGDHPVSLDASTRPPDWPWPESRLAYGNGLVVEARLVAAVVLADDAALERALATLRWLVAIETAPGHLSPTPVGGWAAGEPRPGFDQQPIEAWTLADAALAAHAITGEERWATAVRLSAAWFAGVNDTGTSMWDRTTGRAYDGLRHTGVNANEGAESALALVGTLHALDQLGGGDKADGLDERRAARPDGRQVRRASK